MAELLFTDTIAKIIIMDRPIKRRFWFDGTSDFAELEQSISRIVKFDDGRIFRETLLPGFRFDGASIPWMFWGFVGHPFENNVCVPAAFHDSGYEFHLNARKDEDSLFGQGIKRCGGNGWEKVAAVRAFGGPAWRSKPIFDNEGLYIREELKSCSGSLKEKAIR